MLLSLNAFQFHKVRLKHDKAIGNASRRKGISILQSPIKAWRWCWPRKENCISILQSPIKAQTIFGKRAEWFIFQFYKVRLKLCVGNRAYDAPKFQFYKVRLKLSISSTMVCSRKFQFYKVRLKLERRSKKSKSNRISILQSPIKAVARD